MLSAILVPFTALVHALWTALGAATILFSVADPRGDATGDGGYSLPAAEASAGGLDLRTFTAANVDGKLELRLALDQVDPADSPNGFARPVFEVFIGDGRGGEDRLGATGFSSLPGQGWRYHLRVNGWRAELEQRASDPAEGAPPAPPGPPTVSVQGAQVVIHTAIPASEGYGYWAFVGLYDPLSPDGLRRPVALADELELVSRLADAPPVLDALSPTSQVGFWSTREVPPLGNAPDRSNWLLISGLVGACLALAATIWGLFRS